MVWRKTLLPTPGVQNSKINNSHSNHVRDPFDCAESSHNDVLSFIVNMPQRKTNEFKSLRNIETEEMRRRCYEQTSRHSVYFVSLSLLSSSIGR